MLILISGPYRSGTNDDEVLMKQNLDKLEAVALPLFKMDHIPIIGEWLALPLLHLAGSTKPGDEAYQEISYPIAHRILLKCDAVLRIEGASKGANEDVRIAKENGLKIYYSINDVPAESVQEILDQNPEAHVRVHSIKTIVNYKETAIRFIAV